MPHLSLCDCGASFHFLVTICSTAGPPLPVASLDACGVPPPGVTLCDIGAWHALANPSQKQPSPDTTSGNVSLTKRL